VLAASNAPGIKIILALEWAWHTDVIQTCAA